MPAGRRERQSLQYDPYDYQTEADLEWPDAAHAECHVLQAECDFALHTAKTIPTTLDIKPQLHW